MVDLKMRKLLHACMKKRENCRRVTTAEQLGFFELSLQLSFFIWQLGSFIVALEKHI